MCKLLKKEKRISVETSEVYPLQHQWNAIVVTIKLLYRLLLLSVIIPDAKQSFEITCEL